MYVLWYITYIWEQHRFEFSLNPFLDLLFSFPRSSGVVLWCRHKNIYKLNSEFLHCLPLLLLQGVPIKGAWPHTPGTILCRTNESTQWPTLTRGLIAIPFWVREKLTYPDCKTSKSYTAGTIWHLYWRITDNKSPWIASMSCERGCEGSNLIFLDLIFWAG